MKPLPLTITLLIAHLFLSCKDKTEGQVTKIKQEEFESKAPEPPPPSFSCANSITLEGWFFKLCDTERPDNSIIVYKFALFETDKCYAICLSSNDRTEYFPLSKTEYKNLSWKQVLNKIRMQLKEFTVTEKFSNSSLAKAKAITIQFDDDDLLSLK
jgi:hypothetical protein